MKRFKGVVAVKDWMFRQKDRLRNQLNTNQAIIAGPYNGCVAVYGKGSAAMRHIRNQASAAAEEAILNTVKATLLADSEGRRRFFEYINDPEHDEASRRKMKNVLDQSRILP